MSDELSDRGRKDREHIDIHEKDDIRYWTEELGVSVERLKELVRKFGPNVKDLRREFAKV